MKLYSSICAVWFLLFTLPLASGCRQKTPPTPQESIQQGDGFVQSGKLTDAVTAYRAALQGVPRDADTRLKLADALIRTGDWPQAALETVRAADLRPDDRELQVRAAALSATQAKFIDARDRAAEVLRGAPDHVGALVVWAGAVSEQTFPDSGLMAFDRALRAGRRREVDQQAQRSMTIATDRDADAKKALDRALAVAPSDATVQVAMANHLFVTDRRPEAEAILRSIADAPRNQAPWAYLPYNPANGVLRVLGEWYAYTGRGTDAEKYLNRAVERGDAEAMVPLSDLYAQASREQDALALLQKVPPQFDQTGDVSLRIARLEFNLGRSDSALRRIDELLKRQTHTPQALLAKAEIRASQRAWSDVVPLARESLVLDASSAEASLLLCDALEAMGQKQQAFDELREAVRRNPADARLAERFATLAVSLGRSDDALSFARDASRRSPNDPAIAMVLARALAATGDNRRAEQELQRVLVSNPDNVQVLTQLGAVQTAIGNSVAARATLARARQRAPDSFDTLSALVSLELKEQKTAAARQLTDDALTSHPRQSRYLLLAARVSEASKDSARTESLLRQTLEIDRQNIPAALALARVLAERGRGPEAIGFLQQFTANRSATEPRTLLASLLEDAGRSQEAGALYEKILADDAGATAAATGLAAIQIEHGGDLDKALDLATAAHEKNPDDPVANDLLGRIYVAKDLPGHAITYFQAAVRADPDNALYRLHFGTVLQRVGQYREGQEELKRAVQLDPRVANLPEIRGALGASQRR